MKKLWLTSAVLLVILVALYLTYRSWTTDAQPPNILAAQTAIINPNQSNTKPASSALLSQILAPPTLGGGTYKPNVGRQLRQIPGPLEMSYKNPNWWLYARSQEDAAWLNRHGYPTPSEEAKLKTATESELTAMAQIGDLNAKVHLASRSAIAEFQGANLTKAEGASNKLAYLAQEDGPYAAIKAMTTFGDIRNMFNDVPEAERTEFQRKALREYSKAYELAYAIAQAYGEHTAELVRSYTIAPQSLGLVGRKDFIAADFAQSLANTSRDRIARGLPPLNLEPRPLPPEVANGSLNYQQATMVLERQ